MPNPFDLVGLHEFVTDSTGKSVILKSNGVEIAELDFINFMNDPNGVMRAKMKTIETIKGKRKETPVDIFIQEFKFRDLQLSIVGVERVSKTNFSISIGYQIWQKEFHLTGFVKGRGININKKDLAELFKAFVREFN